MPLIFAFLMCIYGVEVSQFLILTDTFTDTFGINRHWVVAILLCCVFYGSLGGVSRLAKICTCMMPPFLLGYIIVCLWIIIDQSAALWMYFPIIFKSAFTGHSAIGGFAGSTFLMAIQYGTARAVYSGDIGIGYDSIIQSETRIQQAKYQARLSILSLLNNTLICTLSCLVVLVTGIWCENTSLKPSEYVVTALGRYLPYAEIIMAIIFFLVGFTTIMAYFVVGLKSSRFIHPKLGERIYLIYAFFAFIFFSYYDQTQVMLLMSVSGGLLMLCNLSGIWKLRHELKFK
jgi:AGCS family alanine or glycine:cation symporter